MTVGNVTEDTGFTGGASRTISHNHNGDALLVGRGGFEPWDDISGVTWNGAAMGLLHHVDDGSFPTHDNDTVSWYGLSTSDTGVHDVVVSFSPDSPFGCNFIVASVIGSAASPFGNTGGDFQISASPLTNSITMTAGSIAFDIACLGATAMTPDASQTQTANNTTGSERVIGSYKLDATSMVWTHSGSIRRAHAIIEVKAAAGARRWLFGAHQ